MEDGVECLSLDDDKVKALKPWCIFGLEIYFGICKKGEQIIVEYPPDEYGDDGILKRRFPYECFKDRSIRWINQHHP